MTHAKGTIIYSALFGKGGDGGNFATVEDALRAFLATKARKCFVSANTCEGNGLMFHTWGDWSGRFTRESAKAELAKTSAPAMFAAS